MKRGTELGRKRKAAGIPGGAVCLKARVCRSRLSNIERGYATGSADELDRIAGALAELIMARKRISEVAEEVGWPIACA